jgi:DNA-binding MarR family transcriptional regulator
MQPQNPPEVVKEEKNISALVNGFLSATHAFATVMNDVLDAALMHADPLKQVTSAQMRLLVLVGMHGSLTAGDVAEFFRVSRAAASQSAEKLAEKGLLARTQTDHDRRKMRLSLTGTGERLLIDFENAFASKKNEILDAIAPAELNHISELLDCLSARIAIENSGAQPGMKCFQCGIHFRETCPLRTQLGRECFHRETK